MAKQTTRSRSDHGGAAAVAGRSATTPRPPGVWRRRGSVLLGCGASLLLLLIALAGPAAALLFAHLIPDALFLLTWLLAAAGYGAAVPLFATTKVKPSSQEGQSRTVPPRGATQSHDPHSAQSPHPNPLPAYRERGPGAVTQLGLGLGILSLIQLGLGLAGMLHRWVALLVVAVGVALFIWQCRRLTRERIAAWLAAPAGADWLWLLAVPPLAMAIVAAYVPPGILWGDEPHGYDVLEYHLQLPREWYELRRIAPLPHNVFSYFPLGAELHYLLAMQLRGGPWQGMYLAQLMHVTFVALAVAAARGVANQLAPKFPSTLAAVALANVPWLLLLAPVAYNEGALLLYGTLAVGWVIRTLQPSISTDSPPLGAMLASPAARADEGDAGVAPTGGTRNNEVRERSDARVAAGNSNVAATSVWRAWILAGAFAGFACGVKLTGGPLLLLILPAVVAIVATAQRRPIGRTLAGLALYVVTGTLVFSPWLIRNVAWAGNPVFPEAQPLLGRGHFSEAQSERWARAHSPAPAQRSVAGRVVAMNGQIVRDWRFGWVLLPAGLAAAVWCVRRPQAKLLLALLLAWLVFWIGFTHLQGRFYVLALPVAAIALALLQTRPQVVALSLVAAAQVAIGLSLTGRAFAERVRPIAEGQLLGFGDLRQLLPPEVQDALARSEPVALAGDARAFLYPIAMPRLRYRTVFDVDAKPGENVVAAWLGRQEGLPLIIVDPLELRRFADTYHAIPPIPPNDPAPRDRVFILGPQSP